MARHVFVVLLVAVCLLQVVLSLPERKRRDADTETAGPSNILEGIEKLASDVSKKTQEFFSGDSLRAIQGNATELGNKISAAFEDLVDKAKGAVTSAPSSA